jgi:protein CpxP
MSVRLPKNHRPLEQADPSGYLPESTVEDSAMKTLALAGIMLLVTGASFGQSLEPSSKTPTAASPTQKAPAAKAGKGETTEARVDQRIAQMYERLKITPAQEPAWDAVAKVMRDNVTSTEQSYEARRASIATMSAPDNMRNFAQIEQARTQGVQNLAASFQTLYDGMSDDQKKTADAMFRHYEDRGTAPKRTSK